MIRINFKRKNQQQVEQFEVTHHDHSNPLHLFHQFNTLAIALPTASINTIPTIQSQLLYLINQLTVVFTNHSRRSIPILDFTSIKEGLTRLVATYSMDELLGDKVEEGTLKLLDCIWSREEEEEYCT